MIDTNRIKWLRFLLKRNDDESIKLYDILDSKEYIKRHNELREERSWIYNKLNQEIQKINFKTK